MVTRGRSRRREVETLDYLAAAVRFIRAGGRRVADADEPELSALLDLQQVLEEAIVQAVAGQLAIGRSWAHIATAAGVTRQAAHERWAARVAAYQARA